MSTTDNRVVTRAHTDDPEQPVWFMRSFPLEDIHVQRTADGRTVEAYAAVFDRPAEIMDHEGHYLEVIDQSAFNKAVKDHAPQGARRSWAVGVFFNHGLTIHGTPSERGDVPIGTPLDIRADARGLLTVTRYNGTPLADEVLQAIVDGSITGQSFTGRIVRSTPALSLSQRKQGGYRQGPGGQLQTVRRLELGLKEYGPTPLPAYADASIMSVRSVVPTLQREWEQQDTPSCDGAVDDAETRRLRIVTANRKRGFTPNEQPS